MVCGFMIEKIWEMFSLYANFENFTDRRQTRFDTIYTGKMCIRDRLEVVPTITDSVTETKKSASGELEVEFSHVSMKPKKAEYSVV